MSCLKKTIAPSQEIPLSMPRCFCRAIAKFATSPGAIPYLEPILQKAGVTLYAFTAFVSCAKPNIKGLNSFLNLLLLRPEDSNDILVCRRVLQYISQIFVRYFSSIWILSRPQLKHKLAYLNYRFKILRRITEPYH